MPLETLDEAATSGFEARSRPLRNDETEVVVAFRPELIGEYLEILGDLDATDPVEAAVSAAAASGEEPRALEELPAGSPRRRVVSRVSRLVRNAKFRSRVQRAYGNACSFCDLGAGLTEAAHIRSVASGGEDQVRNGIAVCPTHHAAFDRGLLILGNDLRIVLNEALLDKQAVSDLDRLRLRNGLRETLREPERAELAPGTENVTAHRNLWT